MARIDVEIEEYLDEVDTKYLVRELITRADFEKELEVERERTSTKFNRRTNEMVLPIFKDSNQLLNYIKKLLGLREWHDKERVVKEIQEL